MELLKVYITNLGKYNEGVLIGEWLTLPIDDEEITKAMERIGINEEYEEYFITDYESDFNITIGEYENIRELNEKMQHIEEIESDEELIKGVIEYESNLDDAIESLEQERYGIAEGMTSEEYEEMLVNDCYDIDNIVTGWLANYITFDYEAMARDDDTIHEVSNGVLYDK